VAQLHVMFRNNISGTVLLPNELGLILLYFLDHVVILWPNVGNYPYGHAQNNYNFYVLVSFYEEPAYL